MLTARRPDAGLVDFCRQHGLVLVRISSSHAAGTPGRPPRTQTPTGPTSVSPASGGPPACGPWRSGYPALTVVVRPDRVVAAVEPRCRLPRLPWPIPATAGAGLRPRLTRPSRSRPPPVAREEVPMFVTVSLLLAAVCLLPAAGKLLGQPKMRHSAEHFGIPWPRYRLIGVAELAAAAGILVGLWWHPLGLAAAAGMTLLLIGALITHRRARTAARRWHRPCSPSPSPSPTWPSPSPAGRDPPDGGVRVVPRHVPRSVRVNGFLSERTWVLAAGYHPADLTSFASSASMSRPTASMSARWVKA